VDDEAYNLIEEMALNNFQWPNERGQPKRVEAKFDVDIFTLLTVKMNAMTYYKNLKINCPHYQEVFFLTFDGGYK